MPEDKSLFFYGSMFHFLLDPPLAEARQAAADLIPTGSTVLDIACGTGAFSILLREEKNCKVVGIDLSLKMLDFARSRNRYSDVVFLHKDAADLRDFADRSFDYASILMLVHELTRPVQLRVLQEAFRVARRVILIDAACPLPRNMGGRGIQFVEATIGHDHYQNFTAFLASGGIDGLLKELALPICIEHRQVFLHQCREIVLATALSIDNLK